MIYINNQTTSIYKWTFQLAESTGLHEQAAHILTSAILLISAFILLIFIDYVLRFSLIL